MKRRAEPSHLALLMKRRGSSGGSSSEEEEDEGESRAFGRKMNNLADMGSPVKDDKGLAVKFLR